MIPKQMECILLIIMYNCTMIDNCEEAFILSKMPVTNLGRARRRTWVAEQYGRLLVECHYIIWQSGACKWKP